MPQGEDLEVQGSAGTEHGDQGNDQCDGDSSHDRHSSHAVASAGRRRRRPSPAGHRLAGASRGWGRVSISDRDPPRIRFSGGTGAQFR